MMSGPTVRFAIDPKSSTAQIKSQPAAIADRSSSPSKNQTEVGGEPKCTDTVLTSDDADEDWLRRNVIVRYWDGEVESKHSTRSSNISIDWYDDIVCLFNPLTARYFFSKV